MAYDRKILAIGRKKEVMEGAGVPVGRVLPQGRLGLEPLDPFLMLDHFKVTPGGPGFPEHPHRGFEILTYIKSGSGHHKDNMGNEAEVGAGGLMRLTAGKGMWHGEGGGASSGGEVIEGLQFWVNLKKSQKGMAPSFQHVEGKELPKLTQDHGKVEVKVLVGPGSPVKIVTPMVYLEARVKSGSAFTWDIPKNHQGFVYVLEGEAEFPLSKTSAASDYVAVMGEGGGIEIKNGLKEDLVFIMAAGEPHREPVIWNGPFVD